MPLNFFSLLWMKEDIMYKSLAMAIGHGHEYNFVLEHMRMK